jgi:hypothetical protein
MSWTEPGSAPDTHSRWPRGPAMTGRSIPWQWRLPEKNGRSAATRSVQTSVPSKTANGYPAFFASRTASRSFGARAASSATVSVTYRHAVAVPTPNPAATYANGSPLRRWTRTRTKTRTRRACWPGFSLRHSEPIAARYRGRISPAVTVRVWRDNGNAAQ